jgi:large subunit ribosomal protein L19
MSNKIISPVNVELRKKIDIRPGDTVRVWQKIEEDKGKFRLQAFEGLVLSRKHGREAGGTFTVRKVVDSIGVERTFPLYSPMIDSIEMVRRSKVRRAKLYFVREKATKEIRKQMRRTMEAKYEEETPVEAVKEEVRVEEKK